MSDSDTSTPSGPSGDTQADASLDLKTQLANLSGAIAQLGALHGQVAALAALAARHDKALQPVADLPAEVAKLSAELKELADELSVVSEAIESPANPATHGPLLSFLVTLAAKHFPGDVPPGALQTAHPRSDAPAVPTARPV